MTGMALPPRVVDVLWPDRLRGPWWCHVSWRLQHGIPTPVGIEVRSWVTPQEARVSGWHNNLPDAAADVDLPRIDGQTMRNLPWGAIIEASREAMTDLLERDPDTSDWPAEWVKGLAAWRDDTAAERNALREGRRGRDLGNGHYREVAEVYARAVQAGQPPTMAVAAHFQVEKSSAAKKVARARERGLLPPTTRGRIGRLREEV